tara:strand:- start:619 stop:825 length:207 start_codon:yes stop_codon:yes gene_type:complete
MAKSDYQIYTRIDSQKKVIVDIIGESPTAMQRGKNIYLTEFPNIIYNTNVIYETSQTCQITRGLIRSD